MPAEIEKLDPALVNAICNEVLETRAPVQWDDIAGAVPVCQSRRAPCGASVQLGRAEPITRTRSCQSSQHLLVLICDRAARDLACSRHESIIKHLLR
jgi:hypothetical protein